MTTSNIARSAMTAALVGVARVAQASGDSGTGAMGEMDVSGTQLAMIVGGLVAMGVVMWLVIKVLGRS